ncbi:MAG: hypothetical protein RLZZ458_904 [Planctomycetota bacterium]|jgi:hypothetical protein
MRTMPNIRWTQLCLAVLSPLLLVLTCGCSQYKPAGPTASANEASLPPQTAENQPAE